MTAKKLVPILACLALGACNAAISDHPMFLDTERSAKVVPADGLWLLMDPDCKMDRTQPAAAWPKCAHWVIHRGNRIEKSSDPKPEEIPDTVLIVDGDPPLIQAAMDPKDEKPLWVFLAFEPLRRSADGKVVAAKMWMVPCGVAENNYAAKIKPYEGFSEECMPSTVTALRAAVAKGPADPEDVAEWDWIRPNE